MLETYIKLTIGYLFYMPCKQLEAVGKIYMVSLVHGLYLTLSNSMHGL